MNPLLEDKNLSLEVWRYLYRRPWVTSKEDLPKNLFNKIVRMKGWCPLCVRFMNTFTYGRCEGCPLPHNNSGHPCTLYHRWTSAKTWRQRVRHSSTIIKKIKAWEV